MSHAKLQLASSLPVTQLILMLDCFIVLCELPLYLSLLAHRFIISTRKVKVVTWACMLWSAALRVLELVILIAYFAGTYKRMQAWDEMQMWGWFLALSIPGGAITVIFSFGEPRVLMTQQATYSLGGCSVRN